MTANWIRNLRISRRLMLISISFSLPITVLLALMVAGIQKQVHFAHWEQYGIEYQTPLMELLSSIPQHQIALRTGNPDAARSQAAMLQGQIDQAFASLEAVQEKLGAALQFTPEGLAKRKREHVLPANVRREWESLKSDAGHLQPELLAERHAHLVADICTMITHVGDLSNLILDPDLDSYYVMDATLLALPQMQDRLSSVMILGNEITRRRARTPEEARRLTVAASMFKEADLDRTQASLETALNEDANYNGVCSTLEPTLRPGLKDLGKSAEAFMARVNELGTAEKIPAESTELLAAGQQLADGVNRLWKGAAGQLDALLQLRIQALNYERAYGIGLTAAALLFALVLVVIISRSVTRPLDDLLGFLKASIGGAGLENRQWDLTRDVPPELCTRKDELGDLSRAMQTMVGSLRGLVSDFSRGVRTIADSSTGLMTVAYETGVGVKNVSDKSVTVAAAAEESSANTVSVAASMEQASTNLASVATATEEMSATVAEIASNSEKARAIGDQAMRQAQTITTLMHELEQSAQEIGKVTETITDISSQTNLLALNATIEAARAGAAGKGFAVVANEIKELARQTAAATEDIKTKIAGVQSSTGSAMSDIEKITTVIKEVGQIVASIAAAIEEQATVTKDVAANIAQASAGVQDANQRVSQTASVSKSIAQDVTSVSSSVADLQQGGEQVQTSAAELSQLAEQLTKLVAHFKLAQSAPVAKRGSAPVAQEEELELVA